MSTMLTEVVRLSPARQPVWSREVGEALFSPSAVAELFVQQAQRTPDRIAIATPDGVQTYSELLGEAACIASRLRQQGVGPDVPVALFVERSGVTLSVIWGIMLAGGAYMPLEPASPPSYLTRQLRESRTSLLLASRQMRDRLPEYGGAVICIDELFEDPGISRAVEPASVLPQNLAYIIATSGSTGNPKAVGVLQGGLANYTRAITERLDLCQQETIGQLNFAIVSTLAADLGNTCLFPALTTGACLHLVSSDLVLDAEAFADYMTRNQIDVLKIVPSHLRALLNHGAGVLPRQWLVVGGEAFSGDLLDRIREVNFGGRLINHYGPTETTVGSLMECIDSDEKMLLPDVLPVGLPICNTEAHVMDDATHVVPANMVGELCLGGAGLARGYLFRPDLTADRFVPNPFSSQPGARLYRTGDRARRQPDDRIQVLGRTDTQVKIRGHRVEPEEVESVLRRNPAVEACAIVVSQDANGSKRLVAVVQGRPGHSKDSGEIRQCLAAALPAAMVPSDFVWVAALPLTPNGKLDRKKLAALEAEPEMPTSRSNGRPPLSPLEETIANLWAEVLGRQQVDVTENFFELGGDSIQAIQITARLRKTGLLITPRQLFQNPTVAGLAAAVKISAPDERTSAPDAATGESSTTYESYPLSPLQQGMLFHSLNSPGERLYVSELVCTFRDGFDADAYVRAWQCVVDRHSIFRTSFLWEDEPKQVAHARVHANIERLDWSSSTASEQEQLLRQYCDGVYRTGIDLQVPPLMRLALIHLGRGRYEFVWIYHHMLMDAWSEAILNDELFDYYDAFLSAKTCTRPDPPPYRAYVYWLGRQDQLEAERFWRNYLRGFRQPTPVPGAIGPASGPSSWDMTQLPMPASESFPLWALTRSRQLTLNTLVQAAWALVLGEYAGTDDVVFGAIVAGRPHDLPGADQIIGPLLNTIPARVTLPCVDSVAEWLIRLQRQQSEAREYEHSPLVQVQSWAEVPRGVALFESLIGFQNASLARVGIANSNRQAARFPIETRSFRGGWTNYALSLDVEPAEEILLTLSFDRERITSAGAQETLACVKSALTLIASAPDSSMTKLRSSLTEARQEHVAQQKKGFAQAQRSQISSLRRRR